MSQLTQGVFDDSLPSLPIKDISGGMNTQDGALSLASNQTPMCQNVIGFPGRTIYAGGYNLYTALDTGVQGDGGWQFYDNNGAKHLIVWAGGNMYDTVNGVKVTIATGCYQAGQNIGKIDQNGNLYWSTLTVPIQIYNGTTTIPVVNSMATGAVAIPASDYLCSYAGSIIAANPVIGGTPNPGSLIGSNVNDVTTFIGANLTQCGNNNYIRFLMPMGVAAVGIPPTSSVLVGGKNVLILAQGAFNSFKLNEVNVTEGCLDGQSAQYIPTGDLLGAVTYLGNDNQWWWTNGITGECITKQILDFCNLTIQTALQTDINQKFWGAYNARYQYYICDLGINQQLIYRWQTKAWYLIVGWPSGVYINGTTGLGFPANYVCSNTSGALSVASGVYQVGQDNALMGSVVPSVFFNTPYMHANDPTMDKEWQWVTLEMNNNFPCSYNVSATGMPVANGYVPTSNILKFSNPALLAMANTTGIWDVSKWDVATWGAGGTFMNQVPYPASGMFSVPVGVSTWVPYATNQPLRSGAISLKISWTQGGITGALPSFDTLGLNLRYKPLGHYTIGGQTYTAESGFAASGSYPFQ